MPETNFQNEKEVWQYLEARTPQSLSNYEKFVGRAVVAEFVHKFGLEAADKLVDECEEWLASRGKNV